MRPLYIFDLDGTLALIHHRVRFLKDTTDPQRWDKFYDACSFDSPNLPVIGTMEHLRSFADVWIFSGRSDQVREKTVDWLREYTSFTLHELDTALTMRPKNNYTKDDALKAEWFDRMLTLDRDRLVAVFEDRDRLVRMWRGAGVACFQVAEGDF